MAMCMQIRNEFMWAFLELWLKKCKQWMSKIGTGIRTEMFQKAIHFRTETIYINDLLMPSD